MSMLNIKDFVLYVNKKLTGNDWNTNWQKIVNFLSSGTAEINVKTINIASGGEINNEGNLTQNGNLTVNGNIEAGNIKATGVFEGDGRKLYNLQTQGVQAFTPFCINSGNVTNGNGDLISVTSVNEGGVTTKIIVKFKVGTVDGVEYPEIRATNAGGTHFFLDQLAENELAVEGTFYYFIGQEQTATIRLKDINIYRQPTAPTTPLVLNVNDVWLDTSTENLVSYKYSEAGIWEKWDYVPLGKVVVPNTIGSAEIEATVTTFPYNQNGYTVNTVNGVCFPDYSAGISISSGWTATDNGLIVASGHLTTNESWSIAVNSVTILSNATGGSSTHSDVRLNCFVKKGDVVTSSLNGGDATLSMTFYPLQKIG